MSVFFSIDVKKFTSLEVTHEEGRDMEGINYLRDYLEQQTDRFGKRRKLLIMSEFVYKPTNEKIREGFRYFRCEPSSLLDAFTRRDIQAISALPFAIDDEGYPDTSSVLIELAYTNSGSMVACHPQVYRDYAPRSVAPPLLLENAAAQQVALLVKNLDQTVK